MDTLVNMLITEGSQVTNSLLQGISSDDMRGSTITRIIGTLYTGSSTVAGAWGASRDDFGIGVVSQEAFNALVVPDPTAQDDQPARGWLYRTRHVSS